MPFQYKNKLSIARRLTLCALVLLALTGCTLLPAAGLMPTARHAEPAHLRGQPAPTATAGIPNTSSVLDVSRQAAALLPEYDADLHQASQWDTYIITATLLPEELTIAGNMRVEVGNRGATPYNALYFHLYPNHEDFGGSLTVDNVRLNGQPAPTSTEQDGVLLRVDLAAPLLPDEQVTVALDFRTRSLRNASGYAYGAFNMEAGAWSLASFYPVLALRFGEQWDTRPVSEQGDLAVTETALYEVSIDTPPNLALVTTGVRVSQQQLDHGPRRERFVSGPQRDFFLAALDGLDRASSTVDGTRVVAYYQASNPATGQQALRIAEQSLRIFNARFGRYPLAEFEMVQVPLTRFIGVEYPGVILIEQQLYWQGGRTFETTIAHEVAHQWWYSLVGNDVQGEAWLDEGLTSYSQVLYFEGLKAPAAAERELQSFRNQYLAARQAGLDGRLNRSVGAFQGNYVSLVYAKGALFFHALRQRIGDEAFNRFLQSYYQTYRYDEATSLDMLNQAQAACGCDLQQFYTDWVTTAVPVSVP